MLMFAAQAKPQPRLNINQNGLPGVADHAIGYTLGVLWLVVLITLIQHCIQRAITQSIAYVAFPFILDDFDDEAPATGRSDKKNESDWIQRSKAHASRTNLIITILFVIRWLGEQRNIHKQEEERKLAEKAVSRYLQDLQWRLSELKSTIGTHQFCTCKVHCPKYATSLTKLCKTYENSPQSVPPPAFFGCSRCQSYCDCPRFCEYDWPCQSITCKAEAPISWSSSASCSGNLFSISISVWNLEEKGSGLESGKALLEQESTNEEHCKNDLGLDDDEANSDDFWSPEEYFLLPSDTEEAENWDMVDARGGEFEQSVCRKHAARKSSNQKGKDKKALKYSAPRRFRKKMQRMIRDEDVLHRY